MVYCTVHISHVCVSVYSTTNIDIDYIQNVKTYLLCSYSIWEGLLAMWDDIPETNILSSVSTSWLRTYRQEQDQVSIKQK